MKLKYSTPLTAPKFRTIINPTVLTREEKFILFLLATLQFNHIVDFMIMMPLGPTIMRNFAMDAKQFGMLVSSYNISAGTAAFLGVFFLDRIPRKTALLVFNVAFALGTISCSMAFNYPMLLTARAVTGIFGGIMNSLVLASVADTIAPERRGLGMGIIMTSFSVASIFGVPFSLYLSQIFDWHAPFVFLGVLALIFTLLLQWRFPFIPLNKANLVKRNNPFKVAKNFLSQKKTFYVLMFFTLLIFGNFLVIPFISPSLVSNAGLPENKLFLVYLTGGLVTIFTGIFVGKFTDKYGAKKIALMGIPFSILPVLLITNLGPSSIPAILLIVMLLFVASSGRIVPAQTINSLSVGPEHRASFMSLIGSLQQYSSAAAAWVAGHIVIVNESNGRMENYSKVGILSVTVSLLAWAILFHKIKEPKKVALHLQEVPT